MMGGHLSEQRRSLDAYAEGLEELFRGSDSYAAGAAAIRLATTLDLHERWLRSKTRAE